MITRPRTARPLLTAVAAVACSASAVLVAVVVASPAHVDPNATSTYEVKLDLDSSAHEFGRSGPEQCS